MIYMTFVPKYLYRWSRCNLYCLLFLNIDRVNLPSFGAPQPSDGILSSGDEIMIQFNEPINAGLLSPSSFDIQLSLQGWSFRASC
jgi:hypothetical protein